jgi:uncharacterized membrane protein YfhO
MTLLIAMATAVTVTTVQIEFYVAWFVDTFVLISLCVGKLHSLICPRLIHLGWGL